VTDPLSLAEHVLNRGRLMIQVGRPADARRLLGRLVRQPELAPSLRAEALRQLAMIATAAAQCRRARRLLAAAIRLRRHADELYVEYARAVEADPDGDPRLAVKALRRAVGIDPFEPRSWAALGSAAARAGDRTLARKAFRRAVRLGTDNIDTLGEIVDGLVALGRVRDARAVLTAARFRNPADAGLVGLWDRFRFSLAACGQRRARTGRGILPFPVPEARPITPATDGVVLRADRKSTPAPHLLRLLGRRADPRRAR
jgi:cytochrome c-type biogenesis protein CcmH/NrfG